MVLITIFRPSGRHGYGIYYFTIVQRDVDLFYTVGGRHDTYQDITKVLKYEADVWTDAGDLQHGRHFHVAAELTPNQLWILGGYSSTYTNDNPV